MKFISNLYTLVEIAINNGFSKEELKKLVNYMDKKDVSKIIKFYPILEKFIPYCSWYVISNKNVLAMPSCVYDLYEETSLLPDLKNYDYDSSIDKLDHWKYSNPVVVELNPNTDFEFAEQIFPNCDIWNLFLAGNARMNYYQKQNISIEKRIKYAIVEYMMKRIQFFNTEDFVENKKLKKKEE